MGGDLILGDRRGVNVVGTNDNDEERKRTRYYNQRTEFECKAYLNRGQGSFSKRKSSIRHSKTPMMEGVRLLI